MDFNEGGGQRFYIFQCRPKDTIAVGKELSVALMQQGVGDSDSRRAVRVPIYPQVVRQGGWRAVEWLTVLPGFVFVALCAYDIIRRSPTFASLYLFGRLSHMRAPVGQPDQWDNAMCVERELVELELWADRKLFEVRQLARSLRHAQAQPPQPHSYGEGASVVIASGPFNGTKAQVERVNKGGLLTVRIGNSVMVKISACLLAPAPV